MQAKNNHAKKLYIGAFVVGAVKCGTSSLANLLFQHPHITPARHDPAVRAGLARHAGNTSRRVLKEPRIILSRAQGMLVDRKKGVVESSNPHHRWRRRKLDKHLVDWLPDAPQTRPDNWKSLAADCSPAYFDCAGCAEAIKGLYPDARIIITLRHPTDWLYSFYCGMLLKRKPVKPFASEYSFKKNKTRTTVEKLEHCVGNHFSDYLARWFKVFGKEQVKVMILEEWCQQPGQTAQECYRFIGVDDTHRGELRHINSRKSKGRIYPLGWLARQHYRLACFCERHYGWKIKRRPRFAGKRLYRSCPAMPDDARQHLDNYFRPQVKAVEAILGRAIPAWNR